MCWVGWLHNLQPLLVREGASPMESWVDTVWFPLCKRNEPDSGLANRPLLPGTLKCNMWGKGHGRVLARCQALPPASSELERSVHAMSRETEPGNPFTWEDSHFCCLRPRILREFLAERPE